MAPWIVSRSPRGGLSLPLPLAGEGWGGGSLRMGTRGESPPPPRVARHPPPQAGEGEGEPRPFCPQSGLTTLAEARPDPSNCAKQQEDEREAPAICGCASLNWQRRRAPRRGWRARGLGLAGARAKYGFSPKAL